MASRVERPDVGSWDGAPHGLGVNSVGASMSATTDLEVRVLGTFRFWVQGSAMPAVRGGSQRLLALLGLRDRALTRATVAGTLWPESSEDHAFSSLRSALGRLSRVARDAVLVTPLDLCLAEQVAVDIREARALAHRLLDPGDDLPAADLSSNAVSALCVDVLPDWYDDWVLIEAEEWRQLRLHALEALADRLLDEHRFGEASGAALAAVRAEPLRETARAGCSSVSIWPRATNPRPSASSGGTGRCSKPSSASNPPLDCAGSSPSLQTLTGSTGSDHSPQSRNSPPLTTDSHAVVTLWLLWGHASGNRVNVLV